MAFWEAISPRGFGTRGRRRSCLYRAFQSEFGCSPGDYLTRYRIQRARELLRHSALPIGAVAASVGFQDPLYYSRAFRRETGESPSAWRSAHGKTKEQGTGQP